MREEWRRGAAPKLAAGTPGSNDFAVPVHQAVHTGRWEGPALQALDYSGRGDWI